MNETGWRAWAEQLATGLAWVDADLCLRWVNPALADALEWGPRHRIGQPLERLLCEPEAGLRAARRSLASAQSVQLRATELLMVSGATLAADLTMQAFEQGLLLEVHPLGIRAAVSAPLSATLRGFAHEVKNPLAGLRGAAQLLQRRVGNDDLRALARLIIEEADRLGALANRLLHHEGAAQLGPVNMHQLLQRLSDLLQAEPAPLQLRHDYDPSVPDLHGDADRLQQLLLNLARNAVEAGAHTLTLRTRVEHGVRLGERVARMALRLDVIDDGPGVPAHLRDSVFEPLVSGRADGTGLGLALSREIAHEHSGELRHVRRASETVFSLYLPLELAHE